MLLFIAGLLKFLLKEFDFNSTYDKLIISFSLPISTYLHSDGATKAYFENMEINPAVKEFILGFISTHCSRAINFF